MSGFDFYLVTDTHYYEKSLGAQGKAYDERMLTEQKCFRENQDAVRATFDAIAADKSVNTVVIPGDLTQNGEYESHVSLLKDLEKLKNSGKRILLITALHDYNDAPCAYIGDEKVVVKGTERTALREMYNDYGYSDAIAIDEISYTYITKLCDGVRLLAINVDGEKHVCDGIIDDRLKDWIKVQLDEAKKAGDKVVAMQHFPLIPQEPVFDLVGSARLKNWRETAAFLADNGVHFIMTGHMHAQSANRFVSPAGNYIIDVQTSSTIGYPAKYRKINITGDTVSMTSLDVPDFTMDDGTFVDKEYFKRQFSQMIPNELAHMLKDGDEKQTAVQRTLLKFVRSMTVGRMMHLVGLSASKELKDMKATDFAIMLVLPMFEGDPSFTPDTAVYKDIEKLLKRISPVLKKLNAKLSKNGNNVDLKELILSSLYKEDRIGDNECSFKF